ncbi:InlB B-repeat-containing protein [Robinsoniella peoriensis]|uniref:InlB B-repeat-containing protein n=1 Tax=Robinsoniella peoriensis TaxID=180332 RepID=UPI0005C7A98F|nr:NPCBM/NEW2 domain-containing protein [Robinsoniella peoriensis]
MNRRKEHINIFIAVLLVISIILPSLSAAAKEKETVQTQKATVIDVTDYGADPTGVKDSTEAVWDALQAAKELEKNGEPVTLNFPKGEYHIYKDKAQIREYHTSNTNSIQSPQKTIGILLDGHENLTVEGNDSLFMMHGNMMAIAVVNSENVTLQNFSWDFAVPTVSEMTITGMGTKEGKQYTDFFIPSCFPFAIKENTIEWQSEPSPYTGDLYWTETGIHNAYSIVAHHPEEEMTRAYFTSDSPFSNVSGITKLSDTQIRITYQSARPSMQKVGMLLELASSAYRETAGAFTWESRNVLVQNVNVHFMHGFGWLLQMTTDVTYRNCNFMPRENSGHYTVSYADIIHASGAAGEINIENCNFSNSHDDPINLHGTFTRVEQRRDNHTLQLKYIHTQQGGFPQYHVGDQVAFFTRDTLESTDHESLYTVSEVVSNPGEDENDLRTMIIKFQEELPSDLSEQIGGQPRFVAENVTYAPQVTVKGCTFKNVPTRGILCTTRNPVLIEDNTFLNMSMASIYLSNDSDEWYESGPIRDMTIRNNTFYIKNIGRTSWEYAPAVYIHPVTKGGGLPSEDNPIHKNILIEGNTFHMDTDTVVKAESVENLTIRNNKILRTSPDIQIQIESVQNQIIVGESKKINMTSSGDKHERPQDNVYEFTKCKNVLIEGNTYDDGLKLYAVKHPGMSDHNLVIRDKEIKMVEDRNQPVADPVRRIHYASTNPEVISVDDNGNMTGKSNGRSQIFAYYEWNGTIIKSNSLELTAGSGTPSEDVSVTIEEEDNLLLDTENLDSENMSYQFTAATEPEAEITWSVTDLKTGDLSDTASIDENGLLTAKKSGIVWVNAFAGNNTARKAVIIVLPQTETLSKQFSVVREDKDSYTLTPDGVTIDLQPGDLYQITGSNNVKNLFLYEIPEGMNKDNLRTVIKADNLPVKEGGQWDTGSFILYRDDDNYVTIGKKSHYDGIASVVEINGTAVENGGNASENGVSAAYLGFTKTDEGISLDYRLEDGEWQHVTDIQESPLGDNYKIGFAGWETNDRGKTISFTGLKMGDASLTYEEVEALEPVSFTGFENQKPSAANLAFQEQNYQAGDKVSILYDFEDPDGDSEGETLYRWNFAQSGKTVVTAEPSIEAEETGVLTCQIYPVDQYGTPGIPAAAETVIGEGEATAELKSLKLNGQQLYNKGGDQKEFTFNIPVELEKAELSYESVNNEVGLIEISRNGMQLEGELKNSDDIVIPIDNGDTYTIKRSDTDIYVIHIKMIQDSNTQIDQIALDELGFSEQRPQEKSYFLNAEAGKTSGNLVITANDRIGKVDVLEGEYRKELSLTKNGNTWSVPVSFINGLNSYYIRVTAKDGMTVKQHMVHVNYEADTSAFLTGIQINGKDIENFEADKLKYLTTLDEGAATLELAAVPNAGAEIKIVINDVITEGNEAVSSNLQKGRNLIKIIVTAPDGINKVIYNINAILPYKENVNLQDILLNEKNVAAEFGEENSITEYISGDTVQVKAAAQDNGAKVELVCGTQKAEGIQSAEGEFFIHRENPQIKVKVTARDGKTTDEKVINLKKAVYLSDLTYEPGATVGYGEIQKDKSSSGNALTLADDLGKAVTFHKGIGTHAESVIEYNITGKEYEKLEGYAGVDYDQYNAEYGSVQFQIFVDGEKKFDSGVMLQKTSMKKVDLKIKGASRITLKALAGENNWNDHADWADMKLLSEFQEQAINEFTQTIQRPEHGTITSSVEGTKLTQGSTVTYTFAPEEGYRLKSAAINEALINPENGIYTIESVERDITVTAEFDKIPAPKYTVIFDSNGGSKVENQIVQEHERVTRPADPVRNGYTFGGWYQDSSLTVSWNFEANQILADTTIYAKWKKDVIPSPGKVNKITLNKKSVNLAVKDSVKISAIVLPANAQNKAVEWTSSNSKVAVVDSTGKVSAKGAGEAIITATAKDGSMVKDQCRVKVGYRITYKLNKGTNAPANPSIYISDQLIKLKKPSRKGYYFSGWYKDRKFKKKITRISKGTKGNQTVYAKWSRVKTEKVNNLELAGKKKGKLKVRFQKVSKASGYQIVYAANKKFKKSRKIDVTRTFKTISKLKKGIYYVKVRAYKKDSKNAKVYGKYSIVKSIRIK